MIETLDGPLAAFVGAGPYAAMARSMGDPDTVWCRTCERAEKIDAAECLRTGWPKCCGATMALDRQEGVTR